MLAVALMGFGDATYLTAKHLQGIVPPCTTAGCETVLTSSYAVILGIPVSALGVLYYGLIIGLLVAYLDSHNARLVSWAAWATYLGLIASLYFVLLQLFVIHAICQYCMLSAASSTVLFICGRFLLPRTSEAVS